MVEGGTCTTNAEVIFRAGAGVNTTAVSDTNLAFAIKAAEAFLIAATRINWVDGYGALNTDVKQLVSGVVSRLAAMDCINYDFSGYPARINAETMLDVLWDRARKDIEILQQKGASDFMIAVV